MSKDRDRDKERNWDRDKDEPYMVISFSYKEDRVPKDPQKQDVPQTG